MDSNNEMWGETPNLQANAVVFKKERFKMKDAKCNNALQVLPNSYIHKSIA